MSTTGQLITCHSKQKVANLKFQGDISSTPTCYSGNCEGISALIFSVEQEVQNADLNHLNVWVRVS